MHSTRLASCTLIHDGDFDGCMYLCDPEGNGIVVTRKHLEFTARQRRDQSRVCVHGPNREVHDRHDVTLAPDYEYLKEGPWQQLAITVDRRDIEAFLVLYRTHQVSALAEQVGAPGDSFLQLAAQLDKTIALLSRARERATSATA